jgi:hypothetical protein
VVLVVEIVSVGSRKNDLVTKRAAWPIPAALDVIQLLTPPTT